MVSKRPRNEDGEQEGQDGQQEQQPPSSSNTAVAGTNANAAPDPSSLSPNGHTRVVLKSLEIEHHMDVDDEDDEGEFEDLPLIPDDGGGFPSKSQARGRKKTTPSSNSSTSNMSSYVSQIITTTRQSLHKPNSASTRNILLISFVAFLCLVFVRHVVAVVGSITVADTAPAPLENVVGFHEGSAGKNVHSGAMGAGAKLAPSGGGWHKVGGFFTNLNGDDEEENKEEGTNSSLKHGREDVTIGSSHYDPYISPYADVRRNLTVEDRVEEMTQWNEKLKDIQETWGYWNFTDTYSQKNGGKSRPMADYSQLNDHSGELDPEDFPKDSWQTDPEYVQDFIAEARSLIDRVREGIYAEYGHGLPLNDEEKEKRALNFGVQVLKDGEGIQNDNGVAWFDESSFRAWGKRLLNAILTNDHYFVVLGGHSAAAGHGNNFGQNYMMQFHAVMEPVFDRMGMTLVTRNVAQGGMGTIQTALAGAGIYGEKDFLLWDSSMTEKGGGHQDLYFRQGLMTGHRVPVIFGMGGTNVHRTLHSEAGAHVGGMKEAHGWLAKTTGDGSVPQEGAALPHALKNLFCENGGSECREKYNAKCWVDDRIDVVPPTKQGGFGSQVGWHPGFRAHRWRGRKLALMFLQALDEALDQWVNATGTNDGDSQQHPPPKEYWHVSQEDDAIRQKVMDRATLYPDAPSACENVMKFIPRVCRVPMRGNGEWTPRAYPVQSSIRALMKPSPLLEGGFVPEIDMFGSVAYGGKEVAIPGQRIPYGEVDVEGIAWGTRKVEEDIEERRRVLSVRHRSQLPPSGKRIHVDEHRRVDAQTADVGGEEGLDHEGKAFVRRKLVDGDNAEEAQIVPGIGASLVSGNVNKPVGFCDGSLYAVCGRSTQSECLMGGANDGRMGLGLDGLSGWAVFQLPQVKYGIVMARVEWWGPASNRFNTRTEGWTEENNGASIVGESANLQPGSNVDDQGGQRRDLGEKGTHDKFSSQSDDFRLQIAVNGKIVDDWDKARFYDEMNRVAYNVDFVVLLNDEDMAAEDNPRDMEFSLRILGGRKAFMVFTHLYYS